MFGIDPRERDRWESAYLAPEVRDHYRKYAGMFVDALGDLLPTGAHWGTHNDDCDCHVDGPCVYSKDEAAWRKTMAPDDTLFRRYITTWQPIEGTEAA
ncbi:hypothetical protein [Nocardia sp. NPDC049707]|uniref:hypothetical protein n=1 Tax=Nocardia sp. NPDC049707 TaxID=3154735 RepID=UPI003434F8F7